MGAGMKQQSWRRAVGVWGSMLVAACGARTEVFLPEPYVLPSEGTDSGSRDVGVSPPDVGVGLPDMGVGLPDVAADVAAPSTGCSDGSREGFVDLSTYPEIAGCSGGWSIPGVMLQNPGTAPECPGLPTFDTVDPACGRRAGNDSPNPDGNGCNVTDLCESGWHVCTGAADVTNHSPSGCNGATEPADPLLFFTSRQASNGCYVCATGTGTGPDCNAASCATGCEETAELSNDVFGCGNLGVTAGLVDCGPLDRTSSNLCSGLENNWVCWDGGSGLCEAYAIVHTGPAYGGVLCCRD
jgi:hypothetical protein